MNFNRRQLFQIAASALSFSGIGACWWKFYTYINAYMDFGQSEFLSATPLLEPKEAGAIRFAVIGDFGLESASARSVSNLVKNLQPDFVTTVGDNNYRDGAAHRIDHNIGRYYHEFIYPYQGVYGEGAQINRFFPVLGNHDWRSLTCIDGQCHGPYFDYFTLPGNQRYYTFEWGPVRFFMLDSDPHEPDGIDGLSTQAMWLRRELMASKAGWFILAG
ncbi:metallophosphoesterase [Chloroflexi bacterium TSY]|nr:metallophosphoesterase [Chloroflexi bacterium TSY]